MPRKMSPEEIRSFLNYGTRTAKLATDGDAGARASMRDHLVRVESASNTRSA